MKEESPFAIDMDNLHEEIGKQVKLVERYAAGKIPKLKKNLSVAELELKVMSAEKGKYYRTHWGKHLEKLTEEGIKTLVALDKEVITKVKETIDIQFEIDTVNGYIKTLDNRKSLLPDLVSLWFAEYFEGVRLPPGASLDKLKKEAKTKVRDKVSKTLN